MKKIILLVIIASTLIFCGKKIIEKETYTVGVNTNEIYPYETKGETPSGVTAFEKDLISEIAKRGNFQIEFRENPFSIIMSEVTNNNLDMGIGLITITEQREKIINFSRSYLTTDVIVLGNKDKNIENKDNLLYGIASGSYFKYLLENKKNITIIEEIDTSKTIESLIKHDLDYVVIDKISWEIYREQHPMIYEKEKLEEESIGIAFSKNLPKEFTNKIDNIILKMEADGSLNNLKKKYNINTEN